MTSPDLIPIPTLQLLLVLILGPIPVPTPAPTYHLKSGVLVGTYGKRSTHYRNHMPVQKCVGRLALELGPRAITATGGACKATPPLSLGKRRPWPLYRAGIGRRGNWVKNEDE